MAASSHTVEGTVSQYTVGGGESSCTSIATFAAPQLLEILDAGGPVTPELIDEFVRNGVESHMGRQHLSCKEVIGMNPMLGQFVRANRQGLLTDYSVYTKIFAEARRSADPMRHIGIVLTKTPESLLVVLPPPGGKFLLFDSHSRGGHPASITQFTTEADLVAKLRTVIYPTMLEGAKEHEILLMNSIEATVLQGPGGGGAGGGGAAAAAAAAAAAPVNNGRFFAPSSFPPNVTAANEVFSSSSTLGGAAVGGAGGGGSSAPVDPLQAKITQLKTKVKDGDEHFLPTIIADLESNPKGSNEYKSALQELNGLFTKYAITGGGRKSRKASKSRKARKARKASKSRRS